MTARTILTTAALSALLLLGGCGTEPEVRPDVILIMVDTLRPDHLGCYGYPENTSPNIDRFAEDSLLFENGYSHAPVTRLSCASLVSGFLPHETGILESRNLLQGVETLAERLQSSGYRTAAVISNYVLRKEVGFDQGFEIYDDTMTGLEQVRKVPERIAKDTTDRAIELIRQPGDGPLFLWIVYQDPHGPYTPPGSFVRPPRSGTGDARPIPLNRFLSGRGGIPSYQVLGANRDLRHYVSQYDGEIRYLDEHFKRLIDTLKETKIYDRGLIIFTSDHGEGMGEHDYYFAHGENLYQNQIHVPLIVRNGKDLSGRRADVARHVDIAATILEAAGIPGDPRLQGRDLRRTHSESVDVLATMQSPLVEDRDKFALVRDGFKLIYTPLHDRYELFDLSADPGEEHDLGGVSEHARLREELTRALHQARAEDRLGLSIDGKPRELTEEERKKLRSLGYVD